MKAELNLEQIARVCHAANAELCRSFNDLSQVAWEKAEPWQRDSATKGVAFAIANPTVGPFAQHEAWLQDKKAQGWVLGPKKDAVKKTHPAMLPYADLPVEQKLKDHIFRAIVKAFVEANKEV